MSIVTESGNLFELARRRCPKCNERLARFLGFAIDNRLYCLMKNCPQISVLKKEAKK